MQIPDTLFLENFYLRPDKVLLSLHCGGRITCSLGKDMLITTYYSVIGDDVTYRIGLLLSRYALSVKEIGEAIGLPQPRISHKLAKLRKYGCVNHERQGQRVIYRFREPCRTVLLRGDFNWRKLNIFGDLGTRWYNSVVTWWCLFVLLIVTLVVVFSPIVFR